MLCCSENVHAEVYSLLIETYVRDSAERDHLFHAIDTSESACTSGSGVDKSQLTEPVHSSLYKEEGRLGTAVDRRRAIMLRRTTDRLRLR